MPPILGWGLAGHGSHPKKFLGAAELQKLPGCHDWAVEVRVWMLGASRGSRPPEAPGKACGYSPEGAGHPAKRVYLGTLTSILSLGCIPPNQAWHRGRRNPYGNRGLMQKAADLGPLKSTSSRAAGPSLQLCSLGSCRAMSWVWMSWGREEGSRMSGVGIPGPSLAHIGFSA